MSTSSATKGSLVGLYVDLRGFDAFGREHGNAAAAALRDRFVTRAMEIGRDRRMAAGKTGEGGMWFTGGSEQVAMEAAFALGEEFAPEHPYFPIHVIRHRGGYLETDDSGRTIKLAVRITAAPYPGDARPAERGTGTELSGSQG